MILAWLITTIAMITVAVILSRGGPAPCPQAFGICGGIWNLRRLAAPPGRKDMPPSGDAQPPCPSYRAR